MNRAMESLCGPGIRVMQAVRLPVKFAIISLAFLVPLAVAVYGVLGYADGNIDFAQDERLGTAHIVPLNQLMMAVAQRRAGDPTAAANDGERALDAIEKLDTRSRS